MSIGNAVKFFGSTFVIGAVVSFLIGLYYQIFDPELTLNDPFFMGVQLLNGATFSVLSMLGFFAYMIVNSMAVGMFRNKNLLVYLQWALIALAFGYLIVMRYVFLGEDNHWTDYVPLPLVMLVISLIVAYWKSKRTNFNAFTPTFFFMFVVTALELVPALRQNNPESTVYMFAPVVVCNAWMILNLHKYLRQINAPKGAQEPQERNGKPEKG